MHPTHIYVAYKVKNKIEKGKFDYANGANFTNLVISLVLLMGIQNTGGMKFLLNDDEIHLNGNMDTS